MIRSQLLLLSLVPISALAAGVGTDDITRLPRELRTTVISEPFAGMKRIALRENSLSVDFTAGDASLKPVKSFNFDDGYQGWSAEQTSHSVWSLKPIKKTNDALNFNTIDPDDVQSLFVEGDYRIYNRERTSCTSPSIIVPAMGMLSMYVGFSQNYDDVCRLSLTISDDNFDSSTELWNSSWETGEKPWRWHYVTADLADYQNKQVKLKLTYDYGSGDEIFKVGGYMGDFAIDKLVISGRESIEEVSVMTGESVKLTPLAEGENLTYNWSMPGATPSQSTEQSPEIYYSADGEYDVTLTVTNAAGASGSKTRTQFVRVTGVAPVAKIIPPASFRYSTTRTPMVAPLVPVEYGDGSEGFPTEYNWSFTGVDQDNTLVWTSEEQNPKVAYNYLHQQFVTLEAGNSHGKSTDAAEVSVEYSGTITNFRPSDSATTFDMGDWGLFPGSNTRKITAYAEKFSKPSRPIVINGVYAFFTRAEAGELTDQIANVGVHICKSENGLPGEKLESWWWQVNELDISTTAGELLGTAFPITPSVVIDDEFFVMIDGLPTYKEATQDAGPTAVSLAMASFRGEGNTAYMLKDGAWIDVSKYFPAGANHTSLMVYPSIIHSVISPLPYSEEPLYVGEDEGTVEYPIFSIMGWNNDVESDSDWLRVTNSPNDMTVDKLVIAHDALPGAMTEREGNLYVTDGASTMRVNVVQRKGAGVHAEDAYTGAVTNIRWYNLQGYPIEKPCSGVAIRIENGKANKVIMK